jgi:uncharacterized 2Fe-2S/4Fe-4S cluster protein (DUF4445 family)
VRPGFGIGTTTVSMLLVDLETGNMISTGSAGNGQIRYGADLIKNPHYSLMA